MWPEFANIYVIYNTITWRTFSWHTETKSATILGDCHMVLRSGQIDHENVLLALNSINPSTESMLHYKK